VYHEQQKNSASNSGLQAVNNLLQRPAFTPQDLEKMAKAPDKADPLEEQHLVKSPRKKFQYWPTAGKKQSKSDKEAKKAREGNVSIQVVQKALKSFGVRLLMASDPELHKPDAEAIWGYLVHCGGQWSAMRHHGEHGLWVNLDSNLTKPQLMCAAEVMRLQLGMAPTSGGIVFAVVGPVPPSSEKAGRRVTRLSVHPRSVFNL